ncbi:MAG: protein phosphatase 2C domain-containing protein [Clostridiales bacterium]|nr:protein phosphatase 2C domain-containing protein [Clostridiales bacterium]
MWKAFGASVTGPSHVSKEVPNQDAFQSYDDHLKMIAIADGHGDSKHKFSDIGARKAVEVAHEVIEQFLNNGIKSIDSAQIKYLLENDIAFEIKKQWKSSLFDDEKLFGCTLLVAFEFLNHLYFMQLGDGKIVVIYENGDVYYPIPEDERYVNNMTSSLSDQLAWMEFKVEVLPITESIKWVGLFTDGVENAYPHNRFDDAFFYLDLAKAKVNDAYSDYLSTRLELASAYSKDDTTGVVWTREFTGHQDDSEWNLDDPTILFTSNPYGWRPLTQAISGSKMYKRIEYAHKIINCFDSDHLVHGNKNPVSIKQIFIDDDCGKMECLSKIINFKDLVRIVATIVEGTPLTEDHSDYENLDSIKSLREKLIHTQRSIKLCYSCGEEYSDHCTSCGIQTEKAPCLHGGNGSFELIYDQTIFLHHIMPITGGYDPVVGVVVQHPKHPSVWGIKNLSGHLWYVEGTRAVTIETGKVMVLSGDQIRVNIYGLPVNIQIK